MNSFGEFMETVRLAIEDTVVEAVAVVQSPAGAVKAEKEAEVAGLRAAKDRTVERLRELHVSHAQWMKRLEAASRYGIEVVVGIWFQPEKEMDLNEEEEEKLKAILKKAEADKRLQKRVSTATGPYGRRQAGMGNN